MITTRYFAERRCLLASLRARFSVWPWKSRFWHFLAFGDFLAVFVLPITSTSSTAYERPVQQAKKCSVRCCMCVGVLIFICSLVVLVFVFWPFDSTSRVHCTKHRSMCKQRPSHSNSSSLLPSRPRRRTITLTFGKCQQRTVRNWKQTAMQ